MTDLTSRERVETALKGEKPDRVPFNFWMDRRLLDRYEKKYGLYFRVDHFGGDVVESLHPLEWPRGEEIEKDGTTWVTRTVWHNEWKGVDSIAWPDPGKKENFVLLERDLEQQPDKAIFVNVPGVLTIMHSIRAEQDLYLDFYDRPDDVLEIFSKIGTILADYVSAVCDRFENIAAVYVQDDVCDSTGAMFSLDTLDRFVFLANDMPIRAALKAGKPVVYHSDGRTDPIMEHLISLGVSAINPLQPHLNDFEDFSRKYGGRIGVYGALDNCFVIPDGTPDQVREHVLGAFQALGGDGGLVLSSHDISLHCPEENIEVMVKTIREECRYS